MYDMSSEKANLAPNEILDRWISHVEHGRALDLGAGGGEVSLWLAEYGFIVEAVDRDLASLRRLLADDKQDRVQLFESDIREHHFDDQRYTLIVAFGILHFLRPTELWVMADQLMASLVPRGVVMCQVVTTDDPNFAALQQEGVDMIEPNTYVLPPPQRVLHYFEPGELARVFHGLQVLKYEEYRSIDPDSQDGYRAGATFVGKKRKSSPML